MTEPDRRPDPDALLAEAAKSGRGRLKVFLGMAPGVGKTYEMLRAARRRKADGDDVVIGVVETHGRRETVALLRGLEVLPRAPIEHRGHTLLEFDLDAALARRPELLVVDEYAHSNAPGSRHPKRWQDVDELLDAGIDVWTTLNVQHLESLVDVVWRITGVRQRETVPDSALERADAIELIDLTPEELRERLRDGKVYLPETARVAAERFFRIENLTALRELALRRAAQAVDDQLLGAMKRAGLSGPWPAGERILVLVTGDASGPSLVRAGRRLSDLMMDAPWTVAHVERPSRAPVDAAAGGRLAETLKLAGQLGASTVVLTGDDVVDTALGFAARNNVTQIVIGKSRDAWWRQATGRTLAAALLRRTSGAALHVVTDAGRTEATPPPPRWSWTRHPWHAHAGALGIVVLSGLAALWVDQLQGQANLAMIFLLGVLVAGVVFGLGPALLAAAVSAVSYNFFFLDPRLTFEIGHPADILTFVVFFLTALATGLLTGRVRDTARAAAQRASAVSALLAASRRLSGAADAGAAAAALADQLAAATGVRAVVLLPVDGDVQPAAGAPSMAPLATADLMAARWAWEKGEAAGAGTGTLPSAAFTFHPLKGVSARSGVAGVEAHRPGTVDPRFVAALLDQGAIALERAELAAAATEAEALRRSDRLRGALLNSISHDLRTPLSTVLGSATTLIEYGSQLTDAVRRDLLDGIREEAERLGRYVGDLLDMTRIEGGALDARVDWLDVRDVLDGAIARVSRRLGVRRVARDFPAALSLVRGDPSLLEQALVNILENAIAYSPDDTAIEVAAYEDRGHVVISIEDEGRGIPTAELERVFEKFRRMEEPTDRAKGAGLGLAISKGFVEAMGGRIAAASPIHDGRGTRILVALPKAPAPANLAT